PDRPEDHGQGAEHADDAGRGHAAGADVEQVVVADLADRHVLDHPDVDALLDLLLGGGDVAGHVLADEVDGRDDDEVAEDGAGHHDGADAQADDVADPEQLGGHVAGKDGGAVDELEGDGYGFGEDLQADGGELVGEGDAEADEHGGAGGAALLGGDQ